MEVVGMVQFEDRASERGLRLVGEAGGVVIEITLHYTSREGDFIVDARPRHQKVFKTFDEVISFIFDHYGPNNLHKFKEKAERLQREMYKNTYVRMWKGRTYA